MENAMKGKRFCTQNDGDIETTLLFFNGFSGGESHDNGDVMVVSGYVPVNFLMGDPCFFWALIIINYVRQLNTPNIPRVCGCFIFLRVIRTRQE